MNPGGHTSGAGALDAPTGQDEADASPAGSAGALRAWTRLLRVRQWSKNVLVAVPAVAAHQVGLDTLVDIVVAFATFSLCASAGYVFNDLRDIEADRAHPRKWSRPLASKAVTPRAAAASVLLLFGLAFGGALLLLPPLYAGWLALYTLLTLSYSFYLKRKPIVDVLVLSGLYTLRVIAGGAATQVEISTWFLAFSTFLFLSLAFLKRFAELERFRSEGLGRPIGRGYQPEDLELIRTVGPSSGYMSFLVLALYINSDAVQLLYARPSVLWLVGPLLIYWITRMWLLAGRGRMPYDPVVFALTDRTSYLVGAAMVVTVLLAA